LKRPLLLVPPWRDWGRQLIQFARSNPIDLALWLLSVPALLWVIHILGIGWDFHILEHHGFRQSQSAISTQFMLRGGPLFAYETPVVGYPWAIPFEFPVYQWLVALVVKTHLFPLDQAGRAVSVLAFFLAAWGLWRVVKGLGLSRTERLPFVVLFLLCPECLFWSRTFMIESTALCLGMWFLERLIAATEPQAKTSAIVLCAVLALLGALVKSTTFLGFGAAAGILVVVRGGRAWLAGNRRFALRVAAIGLGSLILAFIALEGWVHYTDALKTANPLAREFLTSNLVGPWMTGTWEQKTSLSTWRVFYLDRTQFYLGAQWVLLAFLLLPFLVKRSLALLAIASFLLNALDYAVFTNLHMIHDYYQCANAVFLTSAVAFLVVGLMRLGHARAKLGALLVTVVIGLSMMDTYRTGVLPTQNINNAGLEPLAKVVDDFTSAEDVVVIFGADWSPEIPYAANRRAVMERIRRPIDHPIMKEALELLRQHGFRVGAMLSCYTEQGSPLTAERIRVLGTPVLRAANIVGCDVYTR